MIFFIFQFLRIACATEQFLINDGLLLKNNYWREDGIQVKTNEGYLFYVLVEIVDCKKICFGDRCLPNISYYDPKNMKYLSVLSLRTSNEILARLKDEKKVVLKLNYEFTDCPLLENSNFCNGKINHFENYKILILESDNIIKVKDFSLDLYLIRMKQLFPGFFDYKFVVLENFDKVLIDQNLKLQLLHFKYFSSCLKSFKEFVNHLNCLKIKDDSDVNNRESDSIKSVGNLFKVSDLKNHIQGKFKRDYEGNKDGKYQFIENLFEDCCYDLINQLLSDNIILPIKGKYNVKFYLDQFYNFIKEAIDDLLNDLDNNYYPFDVHYILWDYTWKVRKQTIKMYESIISNAWETLDVCKYFSDLIGRKITTVYDFIEVDKIICDFINMMRCVKENEKYEVNLINPMISDNFEIRLIKGIEIVFENFHEPGEIKAYNSEREDIKIIKNVDYFENKRNNGVCLTFEKILERNIYEIEVIFKSGDLSQSFKVKDNLKLDNQKGSLN